MGQYMIRKVCFFGPKKMGFKQTESVLQSKNRSGPAKNRFSAALIYPAQQEQFFLLKPYKLSIPAI